MSGRDIAKSELFAELGFGGDTTALDRALEAAGLSNARKLRVHLDKRDAIAEVLRERFFPVCRRGDCRARAPDLAGGLDIAEASGPESCAICGGGVQKSAIDRMVEACGGAGIRRVAIIGGSPAGRRQFEDLVAGRLELRMIDGMVSRRRREADGDLAWADLVMLWGSTPLSHKVSTLYTGPSVVQVRKRGVSEMAAEVETAARRRQ